MQRKIGEYIYKIISLAFYRQKTKKNPPILIYQMGKVGSSSIYYSLKNQCKGIVSHVHSLKKGKSNLVSTRIYKEFKKGRALNVISITREPFGRNISAFFQNIHAYTGIKESRIKLTEKKEIESLFEEKYNIRIPIEWYSDEFASHMGVDVFKHHFDVEKGYSVIEKGNLRILLFRSEISDSLKQEIIKNFLGLNSFVLKRYNDSKDKAYNKIYDSIKSDFKYSKDSAKVLIESDYFTHFYGNQFKSKIFSKWV